MKELEAILELYKNSRTRNVTMALATVVNKFGSAYRRPGARMLITSDGAFAGSISGGCIERDLLERSSEFCSISAPRLLTYSAENGDPYDFGSGCEGVIYTLVEPLKTECALTGQPVKLAHDNFSTSQNSDTGNAIAINPMDLLETVYRKRRTAYSATIFSAPEHRQDMVGQRVVRFQDEGSAIGGNFDNSGLFVEIMLASTKLFARGPAFTRLIETAEGTFGVFFEKIEPPIKLLIFGAGDDAVPLSSIAHVVGLKHSVVDYRPALLTAERFPFAETRSKLRAEQYNSQLVSDKLTACVVMHHHYDSDKAAVKFLLEHTNVSYIGVLGPKKRALRMLSEIKQLQFSARGTDRQSCLFAPVGLDIGAETPEEIALSIIAEVKAFYRNKTALLLRDKEGPIHDPFDGANEEPVSNVELGKNVDKKLEQSHSTSAEYVRLQCQI